MTNKMKYLDFRISKLWQIMRKNSMSINHFFLKSLRVDYGCTFTYTMPCNDFLHKNRTFPHYRNYIENIVHVRHKKFQMLFEQNVASNVT